MFIIKTDRYPASHISGYALEWVYDHDDYNPYHLNPSACVLFIPLRGYHCD